MLWKTLLSYAILTCSVLSVTVGYLLWSKQHVNRYANRLLALLLFVYAYINFVTSLILTGLILELPHFFRTAAPLNYLVGPLLYLYVRASLFSTNRFDWQLSWLFLPAVFNGIELIPFYLRSGADKVTYLQTLSTAPNTLINVTEGWLPAWVHLTGYTLSGLLFSLLAGWLLWTYVQNEAGSPFRNAIYQHWMITFVLIHVLSNLIWTVEFALLRETDYASLGLSLTRVVWQLTICFYVIQRPMLLYGAYWLERNNPSILSAQTRPADKPVARPANQAGLGKSTTPDDPATNPEKPVIESDADVQEKLARLEHYMTSQQPYLQPRLSLANVSVATDIPPYLLSAMLNRVLGLEFRDYVNAHRVRYLCQLLESQQYGHLTLEGISTQAGFSSKATFYRAFQKHTGVRPAQYLQRTDATDN